MPGGKIHDAITILLAPAAGVACYLAIRDVLSTTVFTAAFLFGALMFGPDLDTNSRQFSRWWLLRPIWMPYRLFFSHRSRWTHGLTFGPLLRVVYFTGILTAGSLTALVMVKAVSGWGMLSAAGSFEAAWRAFGSWTRSTAGLVNIAAGFAGLWAGAASHTITDVASTYVKTGRISKTL